MNARNQVWVERIDGKIVRIFRSAKSEDFARALQEERVFTCPKKDAVGEVRTTIWKRCGGRCEWCGKRITENGPLWKRMNMHEVIPKGSGGEVSLTNSVALCYSCHFDNPSAHGNRKPQWSGSDGHNEPEAW